MGRLRQYALGAVLALVVGAVLVGVAGASSTDPHFKAVDFATGFPNGGGVGPVGLAFDSTNHLYVMDYSNGILYRFDASGGTAAGHEVTAAPSPWGGNNAAGIAFSKSGRLYVADQRFGRVDEIDLATGGIARTIAGGICAATGLGTDPITGDLVVTEPGCGPMFRITGFEGGGTLSATPFGPASIDGITFGPDGTIYGARVGGGEQVFRMDGLTTPTPGNVTWFQSVPGADGTAVAASDDPTKPPYLFVNRNDGIVTRLDLTGNPGNNAAPALNIFTGGSRGDFSTVGPDGCLYITQTDRVVKITNADGTCSLSPVTALPTLTLAPASSSKHVGETDTLTATLTNVQDRANVPVTFTVTGDNPQTQTVNTDAAGVATFTYGGVHQGHDHVTASTSVGGRPVSSNVAEVEWLAPLDSSPPSIVPHLSGTAGNAGWWLSDVALHWDVSDPESGIASSTGCDDSTFTASGSATCSATNGVGLSASATASVLIDKIAPTVTYSAHPAVYDVDQTVSIQCTAADVGSGLASSTCADVSAPAWSLGLGSHTLSATALDVAGNTGSGSTTFAVSATADGVCALVHAWVSKDGVANSLCVKLANAAAAGARGQAGAKANVLSAFRDELAAQSGKSITAEHAATLADLSRSL